MTPNVTPHVPTPEPKLSWLTPARRQRIYMILTALVPIAVLYGWVDESSAPIWIGVVGAVLGTSMAAANTSADQ